MPAIGGHGPAECFGTPARFAFSLLLQLSLAWFHSDGEHRAAAASVFRNEMEGTDSMSPVADSASTVAADLWYRPHEVVFTSREALQENNVPLDKDTLLLPSNRVRLPDVTRSVKSQEFAGHSSELPHMHALVVLPAKSPEQMLVDGRCRYGNLYIRVRPIEEADDVVALEVDDAFVPSGSGTRLQLPVDSVIIKDGVLDTGSDALLLCSEVGESPVLITLFSLTTSSMPRFSPEPFSLLFKPQQIDIFRSASPNSAVLQIKGAVEGAWPTSSRDGEGHTDVVNYLARVDDPTQIQILQFLHSTIRSARCHLERRTLGRPVIFSCEDWDSTLQDITSRTRVPTGGKKLASNSLSRNGTSSRESGISRILVGAGVLGAMLLVMLGAAGRARYLESDYGSFGKDDFTKVYSRSTSVLRDSVSGNLLFALDAARPSNLRAVYNYLDKHGGPEAESRFARAALLSGTSLYGALAAAGYTGYKVAELMSALRKKHDILTPRDRFSKARQVAARTPVTQSVAFREESDKTVIFVVVP